MKLSIDDLVVLLTACQFARIETGDEWDAMSMRLINELAKRREENGK